MPNQFNSASDGDLEQYFATDYWLIEQYIGNELWVWGGTVVGLLGNNVASATVSTPITTFAGGTNWKQVCMGESHCAGIKTDGTLWVWGSQGYGRLGIGGLTSGSTNTPVTTFAGGTDWKQVSISSSGSGAIKTDGTLWTWGQGTSGQNGDATLVNKSTPVTTFAGGTDWNQLTMTQAGSIAVKTDGTLWLWGGLPDGAGGNNNPYLSNYSTPITTFVGGTNWKKATGGQNILMALKTDGTLWTWGNGLYGALGRRTAFSGSNSTPVTTFAGGTDWADTAGGLPEELYTISGGGTFSAAIKTDGTLWNWGNGTGGQLGNAAIINISTPVTTFIGGTDWRQVSVGGSHSAAIKTDGTLWTWGNGNGGALGNGVTTNVSTPVTTFIGGTDWKQLSCGDNNSTAAVKTDGTLWIWGSGSNGKLGNAVTTNVSTPVTTFSGGTNWNQISCGYSHTAALKTDGTLWIWGNASEGRLGDGTISPTIISTPITTFAGGTNWKQIEMGPSNGTAIKTDGTLWAWGNGAGGRHGNANTSTNISTPVTTFAGGTDWKQVCAGGLASAHTAAIKTDGTLWTWGVGSNGQLGDATTSNTSTPVTTFVGGTNWKQVSTGITHTLALKDDGVNKELYVFGNNTSRQLGSYTASGNLVPNTTFAGGTNWKEICSGGHTTFGAIKKDGTLWVWGNNFNASNGLLGIGGSTNGIQCSTPITTFAGGNNWKSVAWSRLGATAIKTDGTLWTWGGGALLGNATVADRSTPVTTFAGGNDWKQVMRSVRDSQAAAVKYGTQADLPLS